MLDENVYYLILSIVVMQSINVVAIYAVRGVRVSHNDHCQPIEGINIFLSVTHHYIISLILFIVLIYGDNRDNQVKYFSLVNKSDRRVFAC